MFSTPGYDISVLYVELAPSELSIVTPTPVDNAIAAGAGAGAVAIFDDAASPDREGPVAGTLGSPSTRRPSTRSR